MIGVGINLVAPPPEGLSTAPASLAELMPELSGGEVLQRLAAPLVQAIQSFEALGFAAFRARFNARDALRDRAVVLSDGRAGTARGANERGALLVHTAGAMITVTSSEVSVRPAGGAHAI